MSDRSIEEIEPHKARVIGECRELSEDMQRLHEFHLTHTYKQLDAVERVLLKAQFMAMAEYRLVLEARLSHWGITIEDKAE